MRGRKVLFVEEKQPNMARVSELLQACANQSQWANQGPLYHELRALCIDHVGLPETWDVVPLANGGMALEALAALQSYRAGRRMKWVASAYTFQNLGRGRFDDVLFLDCDDRGLLDLHALEALDPVTYDGIIVTNPLGLYQDFSDYSALARRLCKRLLLDNASGFHTKLPNVPWQAISLHHTKPYGLGEGGLAILPKDQAAHLVELTSYGFDLADSAFWVGNCKISDVSCAFLIDRIESAGTWGPPSIEQRDRVISIATGLGLKPLHTPVANTPMTSIPFLASDHVPYEQMALTRHLTFQKYYVPAAPRPNAVDIFNRVVNIPCHKDVAKVNDDEIRDDIQRVLAQSRPTENCLGIAR
ncbi:DegT/DnrJ/EryC1/StrS family aminotransferase (plasmid) [Ruegeria conchae]|uniref:DegT/DnrJ/EryC1/StrS family aminotransferase n=1 Tax=Ruegeria conchae TaxID=981384 RepID=UPI0021A55BA2|nr:DegT/DnrJ/EryC1/StrS family aminotransferase [Ruegeria conchae]UWR05156.1 DegT/DnrJ/EryC1/StrS family aminotransferase [Ruegeria conchae]